MKYKLFIILMVSVAMSVFSATSMAAKRHFAAPLGDGAWKVTSNRLVCQMKQTIPRYGEAQFIQKNRQQGQFILNSWQEIRKTTTAKLYAISPEWKPRKMSQLIKRVRLNRGREALHLNEELSRQLITVLDHGNISRIKYTSDIGNRISIDLTPEDFQKAYRQYTNCLSKLLPFRFHDVEKSVVYFKFDNIHLNKKAKQQLLKIKDYIRADKSIHRVWVDGHTDSSGRLGHNIHLSEQRAKGVKSFLVSHGVPAKMIKVDWHAKYDPAVKNDTAIGRAQNRRVTIRLVD